MANDNKDDKKKVGGVSATDSTSQVHKTESVSEIDSVRQVDKTQGISANRRRATNLMTAAEREKLLAMIDEEAKDLAKKGVLPEGKAGIITQAVKMAVDSGIVIKDEDGKK